jgi:hypothetical protein
MTRALGLALLFLGKAFLCGNPDSGLPVTKCADLTACAYLIVLIAKPASALAKYALMHFATRRVTTAA